MKISLPNRQEPLFLVEDSNKRIVFEIDASGIVKYLSPKGETKTVDDKKDLALAFVGLINAILANPETNKRGVDAEDLAIKGAVGEMKKVLAKLEPFEAINKGLDGQKTL